MRADVLECRSLSLLPLLEQVQLELSARHSQPAAGSKPAAITASAYAEPIVLFASPSAVHTLNSTAQCWGQVRPKLQTLFDGSIYGVEICRDDLSVCEMCGYRYRLITTYHTFRRFASQQSVTSV